MSEKCWFRLLTYCVHLKSCDACDQPRLCPGKANQLSSEWGRTLDGDQPQSPPFHSHHIKVTQPQNAHTMSSVNFTLAQERVLERRRQRAVEARSRLPDDPNTRLPPAVANLPYPLSLVPGRGLSLWDTLRGREGTRPAFRVGQVDAELLDKELLGLFQGQVGEGLKYFGVS